jgi:hypothetical protein
MSSGYLSSLIDKTDPSPYEQVIVLSQTVVNDAFHNMWLIAPEGSPLTKLDYTNRSGEYLKSDLGPPKVQLHVTSSDPLLYYMLSMKKGSLKIYTTDDPSDPSDIEWDIKDWIFAFSVTICTCKMLLQFERCSRESCSWKLSSHQDYHKGLPRVHESQGTCRFRRVKLFACSALPRCFM